MQYCLNVHYRVKDSLNTTFNQLHSINMADSKETNVVVTSNATKDPNPFHNSTDAPTTTTEVHSEPCLVPFVIWKEVASGPLPEPAESVFEEI